MGIIFDNREELGNEKDDLVVNQKIDPMFTRVTCDEEKKISDGVFYDPVTGSYRGGF